MLERERGRGEERGGEERGEVKREEVKREEVNCVFALLGMVLLIKH